MGIIYVNFDFDPISNENEQDYVLEYQNKKQTENVIISDTNILSIM